MEIKNLFILDIYEKSQVADSRRKICDFAKNSCFSEQDIGRIAIVVTELCTNLIKFSRGTGKLIINYLKNNKINAISILAIDKGPGIINISEYLSDSYYPRSGSGIGLGAIKRQSDIFDIYSIPEVATVVLSIIRASNTEAVKNDKPERIGLVIAPKTGEILCGDGCFMKIEAGRDLFMLVDGLGHGYDANKAAEIAIDVFKKNKYIDLKNAMSDIHLSLHSSRGAAVAISEINYIKNELSLTGIGNISASICNTEGQKGLISYSGTMGYKVAKFGLFKYPFKSKDMLIMHTDGISSKWDLLKYPGIFLKHPGIIAGILYTGMRKEYDDATVLVVK